MSLRGLKRGRTLVPNGSFCPFGRPAERRSWHIIFKDSHPLTTEPQSTPPPPPPPHSPSPTRLSSIFRFFPSSTRDDDHWTDLRCLFIPSPARVPAWHRASADLQIESLFTELDGLEAFATPRVPLLITVTQNPVDPDAPREKEGETKTKKKTESVSEEPETPSPPP